MSSDFTPRGFSSSAAPGRYGGPRMLLGTELQLEQGIPANSSDTKD